MVDRRNPVSLSLSLAVLSVLVFFVGLITIASCGAPATEGPLIISPSPPDDSPTRVRPTPTSAAAATIPSQGETASLLGAWADDQELVLELGGNGVFTLSVGFGDPETGTWLRQEDGSLAFEEQSFVAVPHGNILLLSWAGTSGPGETVGILRRVGGDGNLLAYEPSSRIALPAIEPTGSLTIEIVDNWTGLSPLAPIEARFHLEPAAYLFSGMAHFSVAGYTGAITRSVPIRVPPEVIEEFVALLESTPLELGDYRPLFSHTDDYPSIRITIKSEDVDCRFLSESQGGSHIPWRIVVGQEPYVTYADTPAQALDLLDPYLARDVQEGLFNYALVRDLWTDPVMPGGYLEKALAWEYRETAVTVAGPKLSEVDSVRFRESVAAFEQATGIRVQYIGDAEFLARLSPANTDHLPDIVDISLPMLTDVYARQGYVIDPSTWISEDWLQQQYDQSWLDMAMVTGPDGNKMMGGVWHRFNTKSLVWYPKKAWDEAGYRIPQTWPELLALTKQMADDGTPAWCIGIESDAATGWVATDWTEEMMLRTTSLENYDKWVEGELWFDSPEVRKAIETWSEIWFNPDYVYGGAAGIVSTHFGDAPAPMFEDPPGCWLHKQGSFITGFFPEGSELGVDYDFFYLPPVDEAYGKLFLVYGNIMAMLNDRPEVRALMEYFAMPQSVQGWLETGGALAAHKTATPEMYGVELERRIAELVLQATSFRFDASDMMPGEVGAGRFWAGMTDYVSGTADLDSVLKEIDFTWPYERGEYCADSQIDSLVWDTSGGGDMRFVVERDKVGYHIKVERYRFDPIDIVLALTDEYPSVLELVDDLLAKRIDLHDYTKIPARDAPEGTWTSITVVCSDGREFEVDHIVGYDLPLAILYDFVDDGVQDSASTP